MIPMEDFSAVSSIRRRVLVVEDELINREILGAILSNDYDVDYAVNGQEAWDLIKEKGGSYYSLLLLDLLMPVLSGSELLDMLRKEPEFCALPVIVMTADRAAEVKSIRQGAMDFIAKPYDMPEVILARCERIIRLCEDSKIISSTERDPVTGLYCREYFFEYVRRMDAIRNDIARDALVLDIDHFNLINDMYGRSAGDDVLRRVAVAIREVFRGLRVIAGRLEGDAFYVYCPHDEENPDRIRKVQELAGSLEGALRVRLRAGIYPNADMSIEPEARFDRAKNACDRIRGDYISEIASYDKELHQKSVYNEKLIRDVDAAMSRGDFKVYYQPKYNITGDRPRLTSAEALVRWMHPELGMISPGVFIPLFEQNGLIQKIDNYVWNLAAAQIKIWREKYGITIPVSVNMSRIDVFDPHLELKLRQILQDNGIAEKDLMLEITESAYSDNAQKVTEVTENLRSRGFRIEMDDFGTGYSSLNMITDIPIDVLKLDMKFVRNIEKNEKSRKLVDLILGIAKCLRVPVVAEGVETASQMDILRDMGCQIIQGYYFSRPVPPEEFEELIKKEVENK